MSHMSICIVQLRNAVSFPKYSKNKLATVEGKTFHMLQMSLTLRMLQVNTSLDLASGYLAKY